MKGVVPFTLPPSPAVFYAVFNGNSTVQCPPQGQEYLAVVAPRSRWTWTPRDGDVVLCTEGGVSRSCKAPVCILGRCGELTAEDLYATWHME